MIILSFYHNNYVLCTYVYRGCHVYVCFCQIIIICFFFFLFQKVLLSDPNQVIENNVQLPQIIYQQNPQPINSGQIQTADGQIHYIVQEDDIQGDNINLIPQATQQVFYQKINTDNGQQLIQHHGMYINVISDRGYCIVFQFQKMYT